MLVDIVTRRWAGPVYICNLTEDVVGTMAAPEKALAYNGSTSIGGQPRQLGTRDDVILHQTVYD